MESDGRVLSVNLAHVRPNPYKSVSETGIDKRPVDGPVLVRAPGSMRDGEGSGLVGDEKMAAPGSADGSAALNSKGAFWGA